VVAFTSDHGELLGDHGLLHKGPPPYRQVLQVPFLISDPRLGPTSIEALTSHVDVKATLLELLGIEGDRGDGTSFAPLLRGTRAPVREAVWAEYHPRAVVEQYNQTLITADWRLTVYPRQPGWGELFDRRADPDESRNLFHDPQWAEIRDRLITRLAEEWPPAADAGGPRIAIY
jgi:arylsulfatase A-like enzyme